jgi:ribose transport system substrate-binding protein
LLLALVLLVLIGCGCHKDRAVPVETTPKNRIIAVSFANLDNPRQAQTKADIEAEAAKYPDVQLIFLDAKNNSQEQRLQLDKLRKDKVSAAIVDPTDAQFQVESIARLYEAGIPVVVLDRAVVGDAYSCFIASDPEQIGTAAARWLAKQLGGKGKIVEFRGPVDSIWADGLHKAFRAVLRDPGYRFVYDVRVDPPKIDAGDMMRKAMADVDEFDAVFAYDDAAARAAYEAAQKAGREKDVLFIGVGGLPNEGEADVSKNILAASFVNPTGGVKAVDTVMKLLHGEHVPKTIVPPTRMITKQK